MSKKITLTSFLESNGINFREAMTILERKGISLTEDSLINRRRYKQISRIFNLIDEEHSRSISYFSAKYDIEEKELIKILLRERLLKIDSHFTLLKHID